MSSTTQINTNTSGQRSLWNYNAQQAAAQPALYLQSIINLLRSAGDSKVIRNASISGSSIDDTVIGNVTPNKARFTSFTAGILNTDLQSVFNGPNNSQLIWQNGLLHFVNSGISTTNLALDALSRLSWGDNSAYIQHRDTNTLAISDPILTVGDASLAASSDMGIMMVNHHFFGLRSASSRAATLTGDASSFQVLPAPFAVTGNKKITPSATISTAMEIDYLFPNRIRYSSESLVVSDNSATVLVDVSKNTTKIYGLRTTSVTSYQVTLPKGDDDGHVKLIQYLPQVAIPDIQAATTSALGSTVPYLQINGPFCLPPYGTLVSMITLNGFGLSVTLQYDTVSQAWIVASNGVY